MVERQKLRLSAQIISNSLFKSMKKTIKRPNHKIIVDQYEKMQKESRPMQQRRPQNQFKMSEYHKFIDEELPEQLTWGNDRTEDVKCRVCQEFVPEGVIASHERICRMREDEREEKREREKVEEDNYDLLQLKKREQGRHYGKESRKCEEQQQKNDDYYPPQSSKMKRFYNEEQVKGKRPSSVINKRNQQNMKKGKQAEVENKLKKTMSTSKLQEERKKTNHSNLKEREKVENRGGSQLRNTFGNKKIESLHLGDTASKLKKKNINLATRPMRVEELSKLVNGNIQLKKMSSQDYTRKAYCKKQEMKVERPGQERARRQSKKEEHKREHPQSQHRDERRGQKESQQKQKQQHFNFPKNQANREAAYPASQRPQHQQRIREREQPIRTQIRSQRQPQMRQPERGNRNAPRRQNRPRPQHRQREEPNINNPRPQPRQNPSNRRSPNPSPGHFMNFVSQTINDQLSLMNNQFSIMSNIFQNFSNFVNINIEQSRPGYFQFSTGEVDSSDEYTDSSDSDLSGDDDYFEQSSQGQGMDEQQLRLIQTKTYNSSLHGSNQCTICLMELKNGDQVKQLFCEHIFHDQCIDEWLKRKSACPVCRDQIGVQ